MASTWSLIFGKESWTVKHSCMAICVFPVPGLPPIYLYKNRLNYF